MTRRLSVAISTGDRVVDLPQPIVDRLIETHPEVDREVRRWTAMTSGEGRVILIAPNIVAAALALLKESDATK